MVGLNTPVTTLLWPADRRYATPCPCTLIGLTHVYESAIQGIGAPCGKGSFVTAEVKRKRGNLFRFSHSPDRLLFGEPFHDLCFFPGKVLGHKAIDKLSVNPRRTDAVATDVLIDKNLVPPNKSS